MLAKLNLVDLSPTTQGRKIQEIIETTNQIAKFQKRMEEQEKQIEELKKESQEQAKKMTILSFVSRYSTRNEHDIGSLILKDTEEGTLKHLEFSAQAPMCSLELACSLLDVSASEKHEDKVINDPMLNLLQFILKHKQIKVKALDCTLSSPFVDARGREQRGDQVLVSISDWEEGSAATWPMAVAFFEGKHDLQTGNLSTVIGQCQRRCDAILEQQPWRKYVVTVFHCLDSIGFLKLDDSRQPSVSCVMPFVLRGEDGNLLKEIGYHILMQMIESDLFGWVPCPYLVVLSSALALQDYSRAQAVCARSSGKKVFLVQGSAGETKILKASEESCIKKEHRILQLLKGVRGILDVSELFTVDIQHGATKEPATAMLMERCKVVTPSSASPMLFAQYAQILITASGLGVHHNDISLDNLLCKQVSGQVTGVIIDWEHATLETHEMTGFRGKYCFASDDAFQKKWTASLQNDLESLYYVAVTCCVEDKLEWPRIPVINDVKMRSKRREECGLHLVGRGANFIDRALKQRRDLWGNYLEGIRKALLNARKDSSLVEDLKAAWLSKA
jgi:hypothetical protein